jgi:chromatin segregation and condensation protein Rec8/ScpA/Scc1 (kleisin family)
LANIEENIENYYGTLIKLSIRGVPLSFKELVKGQTFIEAVRIFIVLLFLANEKKIILTQDEHGSDLYIRLGEVSPPIV